jgi:hypothetical protein
MGGTVRDFRELLLLAVRGSRVHGGAPILPRDHEPLIFLMVLYHVDFGRLAASFSSVFVAPRVPKDSRSTVRTCRSDDVVNPEIPDANKASTTDIPTG